MKNASDEMRDEIVACTRAILYNGNIYSITLTQGLHPDFNLEGFDWHLSMCLVVGPTPSRAPDDVCNFILGNFFEEHQEIPNPGKVDPTRSSAA
jgi:hypothetical protein